MKTTTTVTAIPFNTDETLAKLKDPAFMAAFAREHFADFSQASFLLACLDGDPRPFLQQLDEEAMEAAELDVAG